MSSSSDRRSYDSPLRREQALATRAQIATAARRLFVSQGWAGTRVRDVAREAGVAEPTVYAVYGSKKGVALALVDSLDISADAAQAAAELKAAGGDRSAELAAIAGFDRRLFERGGDVIAVLREAGRTDPDLGNAYRAGRARGDAVRRRVFDGWPAKAFRSGTDGETAADVAYALLNIDVYRVLTEDRGWSPDKVERWWHESLVRLLLRDPPPGPVRTGKPKGRGRDRKRD